MMQLHRKLMVVIPLTILLSNMLACNDKSDQSGKEATVEQHIERAQSYREQGQYQAALIEIRNALQQQPGNQEALLKSARIYADIGAFKQASDVLLEITPPVSTEVQLELIEDYVRQGKANSALKVIDELPKDGLSDLQAQLLRKQKAIALAIKGHTDESVKLLNQLVNTADTDPEIYVDASIALITIDLKSQDFQSAMAKIDALLEKYPNTFDAIYLKAQLLYIDNRLEEAEDLLSTALVSLPKTDIATPDRLNVLNALSLILTKQGRSAEALVYTKLIAEARPGSSSVKAKIQDALHNYRSGNVDAAEQELTEVYNENASDYVGTLLGAIKLQQGDVESAAGYLQEHVDPETADAQTLNMLSEAQLRINKPEAALESLRASVVESPDDPQRLAIFGLAALSQGAAEEGIKALNKALELDPSRSGLRIALARYYGMNQQRELAIRQLEIAANTTAKDDLKLQGVIVSMLISYGEADKGRAISQELLKANPDSVQARLLNATTLTAVKNYGEATRAFEQLHQSDPEDLRPMLGLMLIAQLNNDKANAKKYASLILQREPNELRALEVKLSTAANAEEQKTLVQEMQQQLASDEHLWGPAIMLSRYYLATRDYAKSAEYGVMAAERSGNNKVAIQAAVRALVNFSDFSLSKGDHKTARETIMHAQSLLPNSELLTAKLIQIELADEQFKEADKLLASLRNTGTSDAGLKLLEGDIAAAKGNKLGAYKLYKQAWQGTANDTIAQKVIATMLQLGRTEEQAAFLKDWTDKLPQSTIAHTQAGNYFLQHQQSDEAISHFRKAIELQPLNAIAMNNLAWLYFTNKDFQQAKNYGEQAVKLAPNNAAILDTLGWILVNSGEKQRGKALLEKALELAPDNKEIQEHLKAAG